VSNQTLERMSGRRGAGSGVTVAFLVAAFVVFGLTASLASLPIDVFNDGSSDGSARFWSAVLVRMTATGVLVAATAWAALFFGFVRSRNPRAGVAHLIGLLLIGFSISTIVTVFVAVPEGAALFNGKVHPVYEVYARTLHDDGRAYLDELSPGQISAYMQPDSYGRPGGLATARAYLQKARGVVAKYKALRATRDAETRQQLAQLDLNPDARAGVLKNWDAVVARRKPDLDRLWGYEDALLVEEDGLLAFLSRVSGTWTASGEMVQFVRPSDMEKFNDRVAKIRDMSNDEEDLQLSFNDGQF
jgi:hypothetical protein